MNKTTIAFTGVLVVAVLLTWISVAWAEDLTIDNISITEESNGIKYTTSGSAPIYVCLDVTVIKPNGSETDITYDTACTNTEPHYQFEGYIVNPFNADDWTMQICNPSNGTSICVDRDFNVSFSSLTNSTSTTVVVGTVDATDPVVDDETFAEEIAKEEEAKRTSATNETLGFRLQILQVLENILSILFGE